MSFSQLKHMQALQALDVQRRSVDSQSFRPVVATALYALATKAVCLVRGQDTPQSVEFLQGDIAPGATILEAAIQQAEQAVGLDQSQMHGYLSLQEGPDSFPLFSDRVDQAGRARILFPVGIIIPDALAFRPGISGGWYPLEQAGHMLSAQPVSVTAGHTSLIFEGLRQQLAELKSE